MLLLWLAMVEQCDRQPLARAVLLLRVRSGHDRLLHMRDHILNNAQSTQGSQAALDDLRCKTESTSMTLGNFIRMRVARPVVVRDSAAARLGPCAMRRDPPHSREKWHQLAPQISVVTLQQVLPLTSMQQQNPVKDIAGVNDHQHIRAPNHGGPEGSAELSTPNSLAPMAGA